MLYSQDVSRSLAGTIGATGLAEADFQTYLSASAAALETLRAQHKDGSLPLLRLPERSDDLEACRQALTNFQRGAEDVLIFGTGGSSLGGQALSQLAGYRTPGPEAERGRAAKPRLHFFDNLDGHTLSLVLRDLNMKTTRFLMISKSGGTPETITQCLASRCRR